MRRTEIVKKKSNDPDLDQFLLLTPITLESLNWVSCDKFDVDAMSKSFEGVVAVRANFDYELITTDSQSVMNVLPDVEKTMLESVVENLELISDHDMFGCLVGDDMVEPTPAPTVKPTQRQDFLNGSDRRRRSLVDNNDGIFVASSQNPTDFPDESNDCIMDYSVPTGVSDETCAPIKGAMTLFYNTTHPTYYTGYEAKLQSDLLRIIKFGMDNGTFASQTESTDIIYGMSFIGVRSTTINNVPMIEENDGCGEVTYDKDYAMCIYDEYYDEYKDKAMTPFGLGIATVGLLLILALCCKCCSPRKKKKQENSDGDLEQLLTTPSKKQSKKKGNVEEKTPLTTSSASSSKTSSVSEKDLDSVKKKLDTSKDLLKSTDQTTNKKQSKTDKKQSKADKKQSKIDKKQPKTDKEQSKTDKEQPKTDKKPLERPKDSMIKTKSKVNVSGDDIELEVL